MINFIANPHPSPSLPLDMGQFKAITNGRNTCKQELLNLFFMSSSECVSVMERNCAVSNAKKWHYAVDELKDISSSIGAMELFKVCAVAGKLGSASEDERRKILANVRNHVQRLQAFVRNTGY